MASPLLLTAEGVVALKHKGFCCSVMVGNQCTSAAKRRLSASQG